MPPDPQNELEQVSDEYLPISSSLCNLGWSPRLLTGLFREALVRHFSREEFIQNQALRKLIWRPEDSETKIIIESVHRWRPELTELRPGIIIKGNDQTKIMYGIGNRIHALGPSAEQGFSVFWSGSHSLHCISRTGAEAENLSWEVARELEQFGPILLHELGLMRFQVKSISGAAELQDQGDATDCLVSVVLVEYAYPMNWTVWVNRSPIRYLNVTVDYSGC